MEIRLQCEDCGWTGLQEDCFKELDYNLNPAFFCPKCGSDNLVEILPRGEEIQMPLPVPA